MRLNPSEADLIEWRRSDPEALLQAVRSAHPLQVSLATGAAGNHLGPCALALATDLNKAKGLSMRKTCAVLHDAFGLNLTPGAEIF